ncbi:Gfo/Idh/MocA family oxidoreductase [Ralstonia pickettii]|nr:Gfo/Idh/MocA family oxidoreductase [Ralstonia pickettii]MBC9968382.1 Gfo/Idh/MocA family oxidoreductase [Ralstonia insidiosa]MBA9884017.1 gfo/Idh/MocA family oxidoreductase [Ralstonia pickettii]MBA9889280.1 gfo/Idh/MocA family oxidoreductase [Ralstonia pickettii]MBA9893811.1 gfo/Idh/MocA family oxidoreductase [Ralstonia pickettii]MBA9925864.1 gfo/Idh/MocA family oxidoreductase [Ralstonia pickettii]
MNTISNPTGRVRLGMVGFGIAARAFLPALAQRPEFELVAIVDPVEQIRTEAAAEFGIATYARIEEMLMHSGLDAVYVGSPTQLHREHVELACAAGKHVLVEKPMAVSLSDARLMVEAATKAGVVLLVGHSHSYDEPVHMMHSLIASGDLGQVRMVNTWCYSDWIYRPRRPDELNDKEGGGVTIRQGAHQFDIIRLLCGGEARTVRAKTFDFDAQRSATGAHIVFIEFANGAAATAVYNGYGRFSSTELVSGVGEWGFNAPIAARARIAPEDELRAKQARAKHAIPGRAPYQPHFGLTLVSCEHGEIRQSPEGLLVYTDEGMSSLKLRTETSPRERVMAEFYDAITGRRPALHDGQWGLANLEICLSALHSSRNGCEISLEHQCAPKAI